MTSKTKPPAIAVNISNLDAIPLHHIQIKCLWFARILMLALCIILMYQHAWINAIICVPFFAATMYQPYRYLQWAVLMSFVWFLMMSLMSLWIGQLLLIPYTAAIVLFLKPYKNYQKRLKQEM